MVLIRQSLVILWALVAGLIWCAFPSHQAASPAALPSAIIFLQSGCLDPELVFCINGFISKGKVIFTVQTSASGWAGFGIGNSMEKADVFIAWKNNKGGYTISRRRATGHRDPAVSPLQNAVQVPFRGEKLPGAQMAFAFSIPLSSLTGLSRASTGFIFATSDFPPSGEVNSPTAARLSMHENQGYFKSRKF